MVEVRFRKECQEANDHQLGKGVDTYGVLLGTFNGRDAYKDAMEEWSDLGRYVTQLQMEREHMESLLRRAMLHLGVASGEPVRQLFKEIEAVVPNLQDALTAAGIERPES